MNFKLRLQSRRGTFYSFYSGLHFHILPSSKYWSHGPLVAWFTCILSRRLVTMLSNTSFFTLQPLVRNITLSLSSVSVPDKNRQYRHTSGADLEFPVGGGAIPSSGGVKIQICQIFPKNCMKLRKF